MPVIDLHIDTLVRGLEPGSDLALSTAGAMADLPRLAAADVRVAVWAACDEVHLAGTPSSTARVLRMLAVGRDLAERHPEGVRLVRHAEDLRACLAGGPVGMLLAVEGAHALGGSLEMLDALEALGVRILTLTWNNANPFATGSRVAGNDGGLTPLGAELLARAAELGMLIDLAHASPRTFAEAVPRLAHPPLVSHAACAALRRHPRNLDDDQLRLLGASGGLIGITFCRAFLAEVPAEVGFEQIVAHLRHALKVAGEESVALGSDFDGITTLPAGLRGCEDWPRLWDAMRQAGLGPAAIERVAWRNAEQFLLRYLPGVSGEAAGTSAAGAAATAAPGTPPRHREEDRG
ncbi:MAG: membrane dipeptidase [Candidatus Eisenbacteria sp.]|nr:membrane dipeptidase [Candidatus Eisenbacteria bacterium]